MRRWTASIVAAAPLFATVTWAEPPSSAVFVEGDNCTLMSRLQVVEDDGSRVLLAQGAELAVTRGGRRFSEVKAGEVRGLVENAALAAVCKIERASCLVESTLSLRVRQPPAHVLRRSKRRAKAEQPMTLRLQKGGVLLVLRRDDERALVRVGELDATVPLDELLAVCPLLAAEKAAAEKAAAEKAAAEKAAAEKAAAEKAGEGPSTMPARR